VGDGSKRYRVLYRLGGHEDSPRYGGSFKTRREAMIRKNWISGELAAVRVPNLKLRDGGVPPTVNEVAKRWQASRVDVAESTRVQHRTALNRVLARLGSRRLDEVTAADVGDLVAGLHAEGKARESIRKSLTALALVFDFGGRQSDNPARDRVHVKLPREEPEEPNPPTADDLEAVYRLLPSAYRLALLWLDWSGARVSSIDLTLVGDYDESRCRVRLRAATTKTRRALWVDLPDVLAQALEERLGPREDRDPDARLFTGVGADRLRTAIARACKAAGIPTFSPHDLRHRRISLLHLRGVPWARIGEQVGQRNLAVTANVYSHVLTDETELDYARLIADSART
jgi:integrase